MKRHPALQPLSREHHRALIQWRQLDKCVSKSDDSALLRGVHDLLTYWGLRFVSHMRAEEMVLSSKLNESLRQQMEEQHNGLRYTCQQLGRLHTDDVGADSLLLVREFASAFRAHIRWEERIVFCYIQDNLSDDELSALAAEIEISSTHGVGDAMVQDFVAGEICCE